MNSLKVQKIHEKIDICQKMVKMLILRIPEIFKKILKISKNPKEFEKSWKNWKIKGNFKKSEFSSIML